MMAEQLHPRAVVVTSEYDKAVREALSPLGFDNPVIAYPWPYTHKRTYGGQVTGYLTKPISAESVRAAISAVDSDNAEVVVPLADKDLDTVRMMTRMLTAAPHRYTILKAQDGDQALARCAKPHRISPSSTS